MKVFVLIEQDYDMVYVRGVFRSREKAQKKIVDLNEENSKRLKAWSKSNKPVDPLHTEIHEIELE